MPKVYGLHTFMLRPNADQAAFEQFVTQEFYQLPLPSEWKMRLLKGDKGEREGKYLLMLEIESIEARDRFTSGATHDWEGESQQLSSEDVAVREEIMGKWLDFSFQDLRSSTIFTDYVVVE